MSFNKRFYNWDLITNFIESRNFQEFDKWLLGPDAHILEDPMSHDFFKAYLYLDEDLREDLYGAIKIEDEDFCTELIKCINVIFSEENNELHGDSIISYYNLFISKWQDKAEKYKLLINKNNI
jgi:hypothetical protein